MVPYWVAVSGKFYEVALARVKGQDQVRMLAQEKRALHLVRLCSFATLLFAVRASYQC